MKTFVKLLAITGCVLLFGGLIISLVGLAMGGQPKTVVDRLDNMSFINSWHDRGWEYDYDYIPSLPLAPVYPSLPNEPDKPEKPEIKNLRFSFGASDVDIIRGEDFAVIYGNNQTERLYYQQLGGDTWVINLHDQRWGWFDFWPFDHHEVMSLTVVLPYDFAAESINIEIGAGNLEIEQLAARNISLTVGLGNLEVESLQAQNAQLEVGLGNAEIKLSHPLSDYRYSVEVGMGSVTVGKSDYSGVADAHGGHANAPYQLNIECGLGSVTVREAANSII